jgi:hypothetical protein
MALKVDTIQNPSSTVVNLTLDTSGNVTVGNNLTTTGATSIANLTYTGTLTGSTGILNIGSGQLYKDASGNVGIGTTSPSSFGKLAVIAASGNQISFGDSSASASSNGYLNYAGGSGSLILNAYSTGGSTSQAFYTSISGTNAERMRIDSSGNVGIGTSSPSGRLHARFDAGSADSYTGKYIFQTTDQRLTIGTYWQSGVGQYAYINSSSATDTTPQPLLFMTGLTERMRIDSSGGVRIGITSNIYNAATSEKLSVKNTVVGCAATFQTTDVTGGYPILYVSSADVTNASQNAILFYRGASSVGSIGTTASATTYNTSSDYRLKENVAPITTGLATISALKPVTYDWIGADEKGEGFIAHELQEHIPYAVTGEKDAVNPDGSIKPQGVDYSKIVVHLVAAVQELSAKVAALEAKK